MARQTSGNAGLIAPAHFVFIARHARRNQPAARGSRRINWVNVSTVLRAAILIAAEVFGAAFAGGWAFGNLFALGEYGTYILQVAVLRARHRRHGRRSSAPRMRIEPFTTRD